MRPKTLSRYSNQFDNRTPEREHILRALKETKWTVAGPTGTAEHEADDASIQDEKSRNTAGEVGRGTIRSP